MTTQPPQGWVPEPLAAPATVFLPQDAPLPVPDPAAASSFLPAAAGFAEPSPVPSTIGFGTYTPVSTPVSAQPYAFRPAATQPGYPYSPPAPQKRGWESLGLLTKIGAVLLAGFVGYMAVSLALTRFGAKEPVEIVDEAAHISYEVPGHWVDVSAEYRRQMSAGLPQASGAELGVSGAWTTRGSIFSQTDAVAVMYFNFDQGDIDYGEFGDGFVQGAATAGSNAQILSQDDFVTLTGVPGRTYDIRMDSPDGPMAVTVSVLGQSSRFAAVIQVSIEGHDDPDAVDRLVASLTFD